MEDLTRTQFIQLTPEDLGEAASVHDVLASVYAALTEKGYNPVNQIVGYIMSGDPTYITSHKGAEELYYKPGMEQYPEILTGDIHEKNGVGLWRKNCRSSSERSLADYGAGAGNCAQEV